MQKYKKLVPIVALVLLALGVNLDEFGIDLKALSGQSTTTSEVQTQQGDRAPAAFDLGRSQPDKQTSPEPVAIDQLPHWSNTQPEINLRHVFQGEINRKGKPTGYHARPGGNNPSGARVISIKDRPNKAGVYTANIEVRDGRQWKSKFSSFFPDSLSQQEVVNVILHAYSNSKNPTRQPWSGPSGLGFQVQGYTSSRGGINTAFPVYNRNQ